MPLQQSFCIHMKEQSKRKNVKCREEENMLGELYKLSACTRSGVPVGAIQHSIAEFGLIYFMPNKKMNTAFKWRGYQSTEDNDIHFAENA